MSHEPVKLRPEHWREIIRPGARVFVAGGAGYPRKLVEAMLLEARGFTDPEFLHAAILGNNPLDAARGDALFTLTGLLPDAGLADLPNLAADDALPGGPGELARLIRRGHLAVDVALVMLSPPDAHGYCSLGPSVDLAQAACASAKVLAAQVNPHLPVTYGDSFVPWTRVTHQIEAEMRLPVFDPPFPNETELLIAAYTVNLIDDGSTLRLGVGSLPEAILDALRERRDLGLRSDILGDGFQRLAEAGALTNRYRPEHPGKTTASAALGTGALYRFLDRNPHVHFAPIDTVADPAAIAREPRMVAIAGAQSVDLAGRAHRDPQSGSANRSLGAHREFFRAAALSAGGFTVITLPATFEHADGTRASRIVHGAETSAGVGITPADVHFVVTEYGAAALRGRSLRDRAAALIEVAHPDFREELLAVAHRQGLLPRQHALAPPYRPAAHEAVTRRIQLKDGPYLLRPLRASDWRTLQDFFYSHDPETIHRRYGFMVTRMSPERARELVSIDQNRDFAWGVFEPCGSLHVLHAVGRYFLDRNRKSAEVAFVTRETKRRVGMGRVLLELMLAEGRRRGLKAFWAQVERGNEPMLQLFRHYGAKIKPGDEMENVRVDLPLTEKG